MSRTWILLLSVVLTVSLCLGAVPARADWVIGAEYVRLDRDLKLAGINFGSGSGNGISALVGYDFGDLIGGLRLYQDKATLTEGDVETDFRKRSLAAELSWEGDLTDRDFYSLIGGGYLTQYTVSDVSSFFPGDQRLRVLGLSLGIQLRHFFNDSFFVTGKGQLHLALATNLAVAAPGSLNSLSFNGYDLEAALGSQLARSGDWSIQLGYRLQRSVLSGSFLEDSNHGFFLTTKVKLSPSR